MKAKTHLLTAVGLAALACLSPFGAAMAEIDKNDTAYRDCLTLIDSNPEAAFAAAKSLQTSGENQGAKHCEARALVALSAAKEGARLLDQLAGSEIVGDANRRAALYVEAAYAWSSKGEHETARTSLEKAAALDPQKPWIKTNVLIARGEVEAALFEFKNAETQLSAALDILPNHLDARLLRAETRRELEDVTGALVDIEYVLTEDPENAEAFLERGLLKKDFFNPEGARVDFQKAIELAPGTATAAKARNMIHILDLRDS